MFPVAMKAARAATVAIAAIAMTAGLSHAQAGKTFTVKVDGSSTVFPITEAVAEDFQASQGGRVRVTVGESGTGGGFKKFCRAETHISGASRPISAKEMSECKAAGVKYVELPIAFDALTVVVNPTFPLNSITIADLKKMWAPEATGKITNWKQVNASFPDMKLDLYGAGTASGTFDYFTEAVVGKAKASRTDYTPTEDDNVTVQGVAGSPGAIGYYGFAYYTANSSKNKALSIDAGKGPVAPSKATVENGSYNPLARPIFIYVNVTALKSKPVNDFVTYYVQNGAKYSQEVGYVALPASAYQTALARVKAKQAGTAFGGKSEVGASIADVLSRKLVLDAAS